MCATPNKIRSLMQTSQHLRFAMVYTQPEEGPAETPGQRIKRLRKDLKLGQLEVAEAVGVNRPQVSMWENDHATPSGDNLIRLARVLQQTPEYLINGDRGYFGTAFRAWVAENAPLDDEGLPIQDEIEELMDWLPHDMSRRMARHVTPRMRLGELYAYGIEQGWPKERLDRIDQARRRLDEAQQLPD